MHLKVVAIDDDRDILSHIQLLLSSSAAEKFEVAAVDNPLQALETVRRLKPDLVLLDWMMPAVSGPELCRQIRNSPDIQDTAVIMVTAKDMAGDLEAGLDGGADDYITKPFTSSVLLARIRAVLRRRRPDVLPSGTLSKGLLEIDGAAYSARVRGQKVELSTMEFEILHYLASNEGAAKTREMILERVCPQTTETVRTVDVHIGHLRRKLGPAGDYIKTINRVGYLFSSHP